MRYGKNSPSAHFDLAGLLFYRCQQAHPPNYQILPSSVFCLLMHVWIFPLFALPESQTPPAQLGKCSFHPNRAASSHSGIPTAFGETLSRVPGTSSRQWIRLNGAYLTPTP